MKLRNIPTDIAVSASFFAVFLLAFVPYLLFFSPDLLLAIKAFQARHRAEGPRGNGLYQ
jgi:hypothetical protein